jgi:enoyl-CoA hydratase/carnithine racemase
MIGTLQSLNMKSNNKAENLLSFTVVEQGLVRLTLNRPDQFNALSEELLSAMQEAISRIANDSSVRVVIIAAAGKAFCAGHDLKQMMGQPSLGYYQKLFAQCSKLMMCLQKMPQVVIAQVQGVATAAGCQLVAMCDLAVASETAQFAVSGVNLGLFCSTPSVALSRNLSRKQAFELLMTGDFITAQQALEKGLVNRVVPEIDLESATLTLARKILAKAPAAVVTGKGLFYKQLEMGVDAAYQLAGQSMACNMMEADAQAGVTGFITRRPKAGRE